MYVEAAAGQPQQQEVAIPLERTSGRIVGRILWLEAAGLLAIVQVLFAGYRMGVGNQTIASRTAASSQRIRQIGRAHV